MQTVRSSPPLFFFLYILLDSPILPPTFLIVHMLFICSGCLCTGISGDMCLLLLVCPLHSSHSMLVPCPWSPIHRRRWRGSHANFYSNKFSFLPTEIGLHLFGGLQMLVESGAGEEAALLQPNYACASWAHGFISIGSSSGRKKVVMAGLFWGVLSHAQSLQLPGCNHAWVQGPVQVWWIYAYINQGKIDIHCANEKLKCNIAQ